MNSTTLQIPMSRQLRNQATAAAERLGFSSLQEVMRVFLRKFATGEVGIRLEEEVQLSAKAIKRYDKMTDDIKSGKEKVYSAKNVDDLMKQLSRP